MAGEPATLLDFEIIARERMRPGDYELTASAPPGNVTMARTRAAYDALALRPLVLPGASGPETGVTVLGRRLAFPVMLAPVGFQTRAHKEGELAAARAAARAGTVMTLAANAEFSIEEVGAAADGPKWFQTYLFRDRARTVELVGRAEAAGYAAVCLTVDAHWPAKRLRRAPRSLETGAHATRTPPTDTSGERPRRRVLPDPSATWADPSATWEDVARLRDQVRLPIVCKGIMTAEDATRCAASGADALVVSNHGARLDNTLATIEALPAVREAVERAGHPIEIYLDGGILRGADVVKAIALGARAVLIGRAIYWGLAAGGEAGLIDLLDILREEIEMTMMLCGRPRLTDLDPTAVEPMPPLVPGFARP